MCALQVLRAFGFVTPDDPFSNWRAMLEMARRDLEGNTSRCVASVSRLERICHCLKPKVGQVSSQLHCWQLRAAIDNRARRVLKTKIVSDSSPASLLLGNAGSNSLRRGKDNGGDRNLFPVINPKL